MGLFDKPNLVGFVKLTGNNLNPKNLIGKTKKLIA
jgi:hypothetical protein